LDSLKKLNRYLRDYKGMLFLGALFLTASNFFLIWIPVLIRQTMDEVEALGQDYVGEFDSVFGVLFSSEAGAVLAYNSLLLIGTVLLYGILLFATRQTLIVSSRKIEFDIRNRVIDKLMELPQRYFAANRSGEVYVRATEDIARVREYFGPVLMYTINTITRAGFIITMMVIVNPELTLWALLPLPFLSAFAYWVSGFINKYQLIIQEQYSSLAERAQETFSSIRLIKAYNRIDHEQKRFEDESDSYRKKKLRLDLVESLFHPTLNLLIGVSVVIVIWQGGLMVIDGAITVGNIAEFIIYVAYLTWPVASLGYTVNTFQKSLASWQRIDKVLTEPIEIKVSEDSFLPERSRGEVEFQNVWFTYPGSDTPALQEISFKIDPGSTVAFVGRTGSGKTTLINLIPRLFDVTKGRVLIDNVDVREWNLRKLRRIVGYVPQETFLFSTTLKENIAFGVHEATMSEVEQAAESAQVRENILDFEKKFETIVGERGVTLSGGQKQRTAIARALIKTPKIVILDDSLSAVDTKTEDAILHHLENRLSDTTTIMISHRISTVKNADTIYYIEDGRIVEKGSHEDLLKKKGRYYSMYQKQLLEQELAQI
jgi:ATP-binding cassette, subfamily B, multidrug efflux pump